MPDSLLCARNSSLNKIKSVHSNGGKKTLPPKSVVIFYILYWRKEKQGRRWDLAGKVTFEQRTETNSGWSHMDAHLNVDRHNSSAVVLERGRVAALCEVERGDPCPCNQR